MRAEEAALAAARRLGIEAADPVTLGDSHNVVVWLRPAPVVAKVAAHGDGRLGLELAVASHLASRGAPVVPPAPGIPAEVHRSGGFGVTFWVHERPGQDPPVPAAVAEALHRLHGALAAYGGPLPSFGAELAEVAELLRDTAWAPALPRRGRSTLSAALQHFGAELRRSDLVDRPLHGSPHSANVLATVGHGVRFLDLETACRGPLEWDLAHLGDEAAAAYPGGCDAGGLACCRALVSAKTAAWCWAKYEHPDLRWHARHHLVVVRRLMAGRAGP